MEVIILGKDTDDKGAQLEQLTVKILTSRGYTNIVTNEIKHGGSEIDVSGEFLQPLVNRTVTNTLICECKALKSVINMPDWLKFLGKVYAEETTNKQVSACFIALSGVNGNVQGSYKDIRMHRPNIELITSDALFQTLQSIFVVASIETVASKVNSQTSRPITGMSLCYYTDKIFWLVRFGNVSYTLLSTAGEILTEADQNVLMPLVCLQTELSSYVNLVQEAEAIARMDLLEKLAVTVLLVQGNVAEIDLHRHISQEPAAKKIVPITEDDVQRAITQLAEKDLLVRLNDNLMLKMLAENHTVNDVAAFYKFFLSGEVILNGLSCPNYLMKINAALLNHVQAIQGGINIPDEEVGKSLLLMKWSPNALATALQPIPIIVNHRAGGKSMIPDREEEDTKTFIQLLIKALVTDFTNPSLHEFFVEKCGVVELETSFDVKVKSKNQVEFESATSERTLLALFNNPNMKQYVAIRVFEDTPQPWDVPKDN